MQDVNENFIRQKIEVGVKNNPLFKKNTDEQKAYRLGEWSARIVGALRNAKVSENAIQELGEIKIAMKSEFEILFETPKIKAGAKIIKEEL